MLTCRISVMVRGGEELACVDITNVGGDEKVADYEWVCKSRGRVVGGKLYNFTRSDGPLALVCDVLRSAVGNPACARPCCEAQYVRSLNSLTIDELRDIIGAPGYIPDVKIEDIRNRLTNALKRPSGASAWSKEE